MCSSGVASLTLRPYLPLLRHRVCDLTSPPSASFLSSGIVSLISLAVLSYERYSTMMGPTEADASNYRKVSLGIGLSWAYSLLWTLPPLFGWSRYGPEGPGTTCSVDWTAKTTNNISYIVCLFVACLVLPFMVIVYCYGQLFRAIKQVREESDHVTWIEEILRDAEKSRTTNGLKGYFCGGSSVCFSAIVFLYS